MSKPCPFFFQNQDKTKIATINKPNIMKKSKYQQYFHCFICLHTNKSICILVQLLVENSNYSIKCHIQRCGAYQKGGTYQRQALISMWIPKDAALIRVRRLLEEIWYLQVFYVSFYLIFFMIVLSDFCFVFQIVFRLALNFGFINIIAFPLCSTFAYNFPHREKIVEMLSQMQITIEKGRMVSSKRKKTKCSKCKYRYM